MSVGATEMFGIRRGECRLPIGETALFGIRRRDCWLPIEVTVYGKARVTVIDLIPNRDGSHDRGGSPSLFIVRISGKSTS